MCGRVVVGPAFMHCILINSSSLPRQERNLCTHCPCPLEGQKSSPGSDRKGSAYYSPGLPAWRCLGLGTWKSLHIAGRRGYLPGKTHLFRLHTVLLKQQVADYKLRAPRSTLPICHCSLDKPSFGARFWFVSFPKRGVNKVRGINGY